MIVIVAVKLNIEHKAVGEPNPHPGNMGSVERVAGEHGDGHYFSALLLDLYTSAQAIAPWPPTPHQQAQHALGEYAGVDFCWLGHAPSLFSHDAQPLFPRGIYVSSCKMPTAYGGRDAGAHRANEMKRRASQRRAAHKARRSALTPRIGAVEADKGKTKVRAKHPGKSTAKANKPEKR